MLKQSKNKQKRKDIKLFVICFEISHIKILHHVVTSQLNCNKTHITSFCKIKQRITEIKVNKYELK